MSGTGATGGTGGTSGSVGRGGTGGTGGTSGSVGRGGAGGTGGTSGSVGRGGAGGMGGTGGAAGTGGTSGAGGTGGTGGAGGGGGSGPLDVAAGLDGQMFLAPCMRDQDPTVCSTFSGTCPNTTIADVALRGALLTDKTVILGGTPGTSYAITLHIQGEVEAKEYTGATDQNSTATSPMADGFAVDGTPSMSNAYGVYMLRVTNPGATTKTDYFLNSLIPPGKSDHTTYAVDYFATINAQAGATIRLVAADSNCSQMKNCGPLGSGDLCRAPIVFSNVEPSAKASNPSFDFTAAYNGQWLVLTVTGVSSL